MLDGFRLLPARSREQIKEFMGGAGHVHSVFNPVRARRLARTWRRPETIIRDIAAILDALGKQSLHGHRVLDFGSGLLLADAFAYAMFGAVEVHAVDYKPLLQTKIFREYATKGAWERFLSCVGERVGRKAAENWFRRLADALKDPGEHWYTKLGIHYIAPFDLLADPAPAEKYDMIASRSTLEHIPVHLVTTMSGRLAQLVKPGGAMYHYIHLADHRDIAGNPYGFLAEDSDYSPSHHDMRGNRLRASDWRRVFARLDFRWSETVHPDNESLFPEKLAPSFRARERADLLVNHYIVYGYRREATLRD
ncbi:MAG: methyltransferase domain-containing protein [Xanthobacteraceae bacterium]